MKSKDNSPKAFAVEPKDQIRPATGKDPEGIDLSVEELEERIAPVTRGGKRILYPQ